MAEREPAPTQPLEGMRVVDMTTLGMGPLAAQILGDFGADVIKVEVPAGDAFRHIVPQRSAGMSHTRSEEHTSELQSLMRISYAVFCLKKKTDQQAQTQINCTHNHQ